jgi:hypothetical protein
MNPTRALRKAWTTLAAAHHSSISAQANSLGPQTSASGSNMPVTWWNGIPEREKAQAISGTQQAEQFASHSPVSV